MQKIKSPRFYFPQISMQKYWVFIRGAYFFFHIIRFQTIQSKLRSTYLSLQNLHKQVDRSLLAKSFKEFEKIFIIIQQEENNYFGKQQDFFKEAVKTYIEFNKTIVNLNQFHFGENIEYLNKQVHMMQKSVQDQDKLIQKDQDDIVKLSLQWNSFDEELNKKLQFHKKLIEEINESLDFLTIQKYDEQSIFNVLEILESQIELGLFKGGTSKTQKTIKKITQDLNQLMGSKELKTNQILVANILTILSSLLQEMKLQMEQQQLEKLEEYLYNKNIKEHNIKISEDTKKLSDQRLVIYKETLETFMKLQQKQEATRKEIQIFFADLELFSKKATKIKENAQEYINFQKEVLGIIKEEIKM